MVRGEQDIELLDPIQIAPKMLIFAHTPSLALSSPFHSSGLNSQKIFATSLSSAYEYPLIATGGSGSYYWLSRNTTIASVNNQGLVRTTATRIGRSNIVVTDTRNIDIEASSIVYVLEPVDLQLQACPVETQSGNKLYLNVQMNAILNSNGNEQNSENLVPINDCSRLQFEVRF